MTPKSKQQKEVATISKHLPKLTNAQHKWIKKQYFPFNAVRFGIKNGCLCCGYDWKDPWTKDTVRCPNCQKKLTVITTTQRTFHKSYYFNILTKSGRYQIIRTFLLDVTAKKHHEPYYSITEVLQEFIDCDVTVNKKKLARSFYVARDRSMFGGSWNLYSPMSIKYYTYCYDIKPSFIYPRQSIHPELKRRGYTSKTQRYCQVAVNTLFKQILCHSKAETLLKAKQYELLKDFINGYRPHEQESNWYWSAVKQCIRRNYHPKDANIWYDMLCNLKQLGKDLTNAKYVCPENLYEAHDLWTKRVERKKTKDRLKDIASEELKFHELKYKYLGTSFTDGEITVETIDSVYGYVLEARILHHCVYVNKYFLNPDSIILTAKKDGKHFATIELSLKTFNVIQCRGIFNSVPPDNDRIIQLVENNIHLFKKKQRLKKAA
jgi:hypothetical protein